MTEENPIIDKDVLALLNKLTEIVDLKEHISNLLEKKKAIVKTVSPANEYANHVYLNRNDFPEKSKVIIIKVE